MSGAPHILVVEPDILIRTPLAAYLRACGYFVTELFDVREVRTVLASGRFIVDVVFTQAGGSGEGGFVLASWLRAEHPQIEVVLAGTVARAARKAGELCDDGPLLCSPYDHQLLADEISRRLAARGRAG